MGTKRNPSPTPRSRPRKVLKPEPVTPPKVQQPPTPSSRTSSSSQKTPVSLSSQALKVESMHSGNMAWDQPPTVSYGSSVRPLNLDDEEEVGYGNRVRGAAGFQHPLANDYIKILSKGVDQIHLAMKELRNSGVEQFQFGLPKICVVGDQSSGKSSVIEGMSQIRVPRNAGACTRCPMEINLQNSSGPWECTIWLVKKYNYMPEAFHPDEIQNQPLGPWVENIPESFDFFAKVTNMDDLPALIECAQLATLNPGVPMETYTGGFHDELDRNEKQCQFSPCAVKLDISAKGLMELSFYDLPGLIQDDSETYVPQLIRNLAKEYIKSDDCLILNTMKMDNDPATAQSGRLIRDMKAEGRTVGVLTKPDKLGREDIEQWLQILNRRLFPLRLGYRIVKNASDPRISHSQARQEEEKFFQTNEIFQEHGHLGEYREMFGTKNLMAYLSDLLVSQCKKSLPGINQNIQKRIDVIQRNLDRLPKQPSGNVCYFVQSKINDFARGLAAPIDDHKKDEGFFAKWHQGAKDFRMKLCASAPKITYSKQIQRVPYAERAGEVITPDRHNSRNTPLVIDVDLEDDKTILADTRETPMPSIRRAGRGPDVFSTIGNCAKTFTLNEIKEGIDAVNGGIPKKADQGLTERLYHQSTEHWEWLMKDFLNMTAKICLRLVQTNLLDAFRELQGTQLFTKVQHISEEFLQKAMQKQRKLSGRFLAAERRCLMTLNMEAIEEPHREILNRLIQERRTHLVKLGLRRLQATGNNRITKEQQNELEQEAQKDVNKDEQALDEMAMTLAYYKCAASRFADYNCLTARNELFIRIRDELSGAICKGLDMDSADANKTLTDLLQISAKDETARENLEREMKSLQNAKQGIIELFVDKETEYPSDHNQMDTS